MYVPFFVFGPPFDFFVLRRPFLSTSVLRCCRWLSSRSAARRYSGRSIKHERHEEHRHKSTRTRHAHCAPSLPFSSPRETSSLSMTAVDQSGRVLGCAAFTDSPTWPGVDPRRYSFTHPSPARPASHLPDWKALLTTLQSFAALRISCLLAQSKPHYPPFLFQLGELG